MSAFVFGFSSLLLIVAFNQKDTHCSRGAEDAIHVCVRLSLIDLFS